MAKGTVNKVFIVGNVCDYPIMQRTEKCHFVHLSLATMEHWRGKLDEKKERTDWHRVVIYGKLADIVESSVHKGDKISIVGRMQTRKWRDEQGIEREKIEIIGEEMQIVAKKYEGNHS